MKRFYNLIKVPLLIALVLFSTTLYAQNPTDTSQGECGLVVYDFNESDEGFNTSPYAGFTTREFYWNSARGYLTEVGRAGQERMTPPGPSLGGYRVISTISPPVKNPNQAGVFDIGFRYIIPNVLTDFFVVRIVELVTVGGVTSANIVASSFEQPFLLWTKNATPYVDATNPTLSGFTGNVCIRLEDADITNAANTLYRVEIIYLIPELLYTAIDDISFGNNELIILPVRFIGLNAYKSDEGVQLRWDVAEEKDVLRYEVERSHNGKDFVKVAEVPVNAKSRLYQYLDRSPLGGRSFYRVRNVDIDGKFLYSPVTRINLNKEIVLRAFPTPATSNVTIEHEILSTRGRITVSTADGRIVKTLTTMQGTSQTNVNLSNLSSGFYVVRLDKGNGQVETVKVLKK